MSGSRFYTKWSTVLKEHFGERVQKVSLDVGAGCPNRDGLEKGGCIFCDSRGGGSGACLDRISLEDQIDSGIAVASRRYKARKIILYFQSYSFTNKPLSELKDIVRKSIYHANISAEVVGISMGTRPDMVPEIFLDYLDSLALKNLQVWLELGVQTSDEKGLKWLNRGHGISEVEDAILRVRRRNICLCAHLISGIKGEAEDQLERSTRWLVERSVNALKFHPLHVLSGTQLEKLYLRGEYDPLSLEEYAKKVARALLNVPDHVVIQRLTADARAPWLIAPKWITEKNTVIAEIERQLEILTEK